MTRWARKGAAEGGRALAATPWERMVTGSCAQAAAGAGGSRSRPPASDREQERKKKKNKKKKGYESADVNGFREHLEAAGGGAARAEAARALRKDERREARRLRRREAKSRAMVCFHCRESGHGMADCPAVLQSEDMGTGICYRCGSTEHEITKCKAKVDPAVGPFPYAKCFICGEMGHLSRSCPDNPKGLYAEGGCCRLCGSVEHFRKDCPENQNSDHVTLGRWANGMSADSEDMIETPKLQKTKVKGPKIVNF